MPNAMGCQKWRYLNCPINQANMILIPLHLFSKVFFFFTRVSIRTITIFIHGLHKLIKNLNYALRLINSILLYMPNSWSKKLKCQGQWPDFSIIDFIVLSLLNHKKVKTYIHIKATFKNMFVCPLLT